MMLIYNIPMDIWTETALELLDARDLMRVEEAMEEEEGGHLVWSPKAVFCARRVLTEPELQWFARQNITVKLLERCIVGAPTSDDGIKIYFTFRDILKQLGPTAVTTMWTRNGELHNRADGGPAVESHCDHGAYIRGWYEDGKPWRAGGLPALEHGMYYEAGLNVERQWYNCDGEWHRDGDLPCLEDDRGHREWCVHGQRHRDGGLPAIEDANGRREWWTRGRRRTNGGDDEPTLVTAHGDRCWYTQVKLLPSQQIDENDCGDDDEDSVATFRLRSECSDDDLPKEELQQELERFKTTHADWMSVDSKTRIVNQLELQLMMRSEQDEEQEQEQEQEQEDDNSSEEEDGSVVSGVARLMDDLFDHGAEDIDGRRYAAALHRGNDKPAIECHNGDRYWFHRGHLHRDNDLPAIEHHHSGARWWYQRGQQHREGGPAVIEPGGVRRWFLNGEEVSEEEARWWWDKKKTAVCE